MPLINYLLVESAATNPITTHAASRQDTSSDESIKFVETSRKSMADTSIAARLVADKRFVRRSDSSEMKKAALRWPLSSLRNAEGEAVYQKYIKIAHDINISSRDLVIQSCNKTRLFAELMHYLLETHPGKIIILQKYEYPTMIPSTASMCVLLSYCLEEDPSKNFSVVASRQLSDVIEILTADQFADKDFFEEEPSSRCGCG